MDAGTVKIEDVLTETRAQLKWLKDRLRPDDVLYVNGHQHVHVHPRLCAPLAMLFKESGVRSVRVPLEANLPSTEKPFRLMVAKHAAAAREVFTKHGVRSTDHYVGLTTMGDRLTPSTLSRALHLQGPALALPSPPSPTSGKPTTSGGCCGDDPVTVEWMCHPGLCSSQPGTDAFARSPEREHELELLTSSAMVEVLKPFNLRIGDYRDF